MVSTKSLVVILTPSDFLSTYNPQENMNSMIAMYTGVVGRNVESNFTLYVKVIIKTFDINIKFSEE